MDDDCAHTEYETVFVKDMAYYLVNRLDTPAYIPDNYVHAFLLRDPHKSVYSLYKMSLNKDLTGNCRTAYYQHMARSCICETLTRTWSEFVLRRRLITWRAPERLLLNERINE